MNNAETESSSLASRFSDAYDVVVVGSGLAGMTAANVLGRGGHKVLLLERHYKLGGLATWFRREKGEHIFDVSLHGFPVGMIKSCRRYWNQEIADRIVQLPRIKFDNPQFTLTTTFNREDFTRLLVERFGLAPETVKAFFDEARNQTHYDDQTKTTRELFDQFFPGRPDVARLLMEPITYANGSTLEDPALTYGIVFSNFMSKGVFTFQGGTDLLVKMMREELVKNGVDIALNSPVEKIIIEHGAVAGVKVADGPMTVESPEIGGVPKTVSPLAGKTIKTRSVLSNANLKGTIFNLVGREYFEPEFVAEAEAVRLNNSSVQVYIALKEGETLDEERCGDLLFTSVAPEFRADWLLSRNITSRTYSFYYPKTRPGTDRYYVVASSNARYEDWANLSDEAYEESKKDLIETTLDALDKYVPGIREKAAYVEAATPKTFRDYTDHWLGASFGTKYEGLAVSRALGSKIPGLYHAGSVGIIMSGWLGAVNYGVIAANDVDQFLMT
ncbi:MAG: FAD-dependent oxidoreductase [Thermoguttaceae bacterium]|jgi:phytoene dehydrogenase-like protein|nr:FAD-dependent oxidoreductase [Thermoguttaceae bacterium]